MVVLSEHACEDRERMRSGSVLRKTAGIVVLQVHAGRRRESDVWLVQVRFQLHVSLFVDLKVNQVIKCN